MTAPDPRTRVAEVLRRHSFSGTITSPKQPTTIRCRCGAEVLDLSAHQASKVDAAGLLADPPPRTWQAGDPEPDDARCVVDAFGALWIRGDYGWKIADDDDGRDWWSDVLRLSPVTEVRRPGAPS